MLQHINQVMIIAIDYTMLQFLTVTNSGKVVVDFVSCYLYLTTLAFDLFFWMVKPHSSA